MASIMFFVGVIVGVVFGVCWGVILLAHNSNFRSKTRVFIERRDGIEFHLVPDQGIEQRVYKPQGSPAVINPRVAGRRTRQK
jgi:MFS superfamily sulfate permease-like transporter